MPESTLPELLTSPWTPDRTDWTELLTGEPRYRLDQLWTGLYQHHLPPAEISNLPRKLRERIASSHQPEMTLAESQTSADGKTIKWLWEMGDGAAVETVLMHYPKRSTVCISSQAGCAMACGFCATGQAGYSRNLTVGQILEQVVAAAGGSDDRRLSNVVYMGMGEPFANYNRVLASVRRLISDFGIGARRITVSTVGLVPQMRRFADEGLQVGLALSLHAANDELRNQLVPINTRHPIADLVDACRYFRATTGRRVSFEWAMIDQTNDRPSDADELAELTKQAQAHVNLIPLNPTPGWPTAPSSPKRIQDFADRLSDRGVNVTVRANRGVDIDAACGQLEARNRDENQPKAQPVDLTIRK